MIVLVFLKWIIQVHYVYFLGGNNITENSFLKIQIHPKYLLLCTQAYTHSHAPYGTFQSIH